MSTSSPFPIPVSALKPVSCGSVLWRSAGVLRATIIAKITLGLVHERTAWPTTPLELVAEDRRRDANPLASLVEAAEVVPFLPNTAVLLFGNAHAPQGRPAPALSARLALFRERSLIDKTVHVFGERTASAPQHPRPFERVPLVYERTWGGPGNDENPVGVPSNAPILPSICDATNPTKPAGFGPISRQWQVRKRLLGVTDLTRLEGPVADFPSGFDFRYYNPAPPDQQVEHLRGDEWIVLDGMHPTLPRVQSRLPQMRGRACVYFVGTNSVSHNQIVELVPDMLVIDADKLIASVVFRGSLHLDSADTLPRLRVFADVELPGNPTRWPDTAEVLRARAPAPLNVPTNSSTAQSSAIFSTLPLREESAIRPALPFQPKPPGAATVVPFMSAAPTRPRVDLDDRDPLMRTVAADPEDSSLRPAMPFVGGGAPAGASPPRVAQPPQQPARRVADDDHATRAIDIEQLEAMRVAVTPFAEGKSRMAASDPVEAKRPPLPSKPYDDEESTRAIDIEQLAARRAPVTPFGGGDSVKPAPAPAAIPGAPWSNQRAASTSSPPAPIKPGHRTVAFSIDDPQTHGLAEHEVEALPFMRSDAVAAPPSVETPAPVVANFEPPPMVKPPAFLEPPPVNTAPVVPSAVVAAPPMMMPVVPKDLEPPPIATPPAKVSPEEPPRQTAAAPAVVEAPSPPAEEATGVRATILERLRSGTPAPLHGLTVTGEDLSGLDMHGANLSGHDLSGVKFVKTNLSGARLGGARLMDADLEGADLSNADLAGADLTRAVLTNTRMPGANIDNACFSAAQGTGAIFDGAKGRTTVFSRGHWSNASFRNIDVLSADFTGTTLDGAIFNRAVLPDIKLNDARGKGTKFDDARLDQARADGSALTEGSFHKVEAKGSVWENATLDGSSFENAQMENAIFVRATCRETKFVNTNLRAANFGKTQGDSADLSGANLDGADFRQARFADARFEGARLPNVLAPRADFSRGNFTRADLSNGSLRAAQLGGANLAHAILDGADLRDADLKRSVLFKASRTGAKLSGANTKDSIEHDPNE